MLDTVALIGFGEAGQAFATGGGWQAAARAYDRLTDDAAARPAKEADYRRAGVTGAGSLAEAVRNADFILSLVTADQAPKVATETAGWVAAGAIFCDMNSIAPSTKRSAAAAIEAAGGNYVDVAIMAPVNPAGTGVPLLVSGPQAEAAEKRLAGLGFTDCRVIGREVGQASAVKMIRSVIVKGIEALTVEAMLAAGAAGVVEAVLASLDAGDKAMSWSKRADYNLERVIVHGLRRSDEMAEVVKTLQELGVDPAMASAAERRQREIGRLRLRRPAHGLAAKIDQISGRKADAA